MRWTHHIMDGRTIGRALGRLQKDGPLLATPHEGLDSAMKSEKKVPPAPEGLVNAPGNPL